MEEWCYDPAADFDPALLERMNNPRRGSKLLVEGVRSLSAAAVRCWLRLYHRLVIVGRQNLPPDQSFVLVANHASHLDTLCLLSALPIRRLHRAFPAAANDYFCVSPLRNLLATVLVNALPFERRFVPWQSLNACAALLQAPGTVLVLFPEGTRSGGSEPGTFKPGVAFLAAGRDVPVVPCHLAGTYAALPKGAWCPRPRAIRLTIGAPRVYAHLPATRASARRICDELREAVIQLGQASPEADAAGCLEAPVL